MNPKEFGPPPTYGNKGIFEKILNWGYTEVEFGMGGLVEEDIEIKGKRLISLFAFHHPRKRLSKVFTYEHDIFIFNDGRELYGGILEVPYTKRDFEKYIEDHKIKMDERISLAEVVDFLQLLEE